MFSNSFLKLSNIYFGLTVILLGTGVYYGVSQFQMMQAETLAIEDNKARVVELEKKLVTETGEFKSFAEERAGKQAELSKKLFSILPSDENYTDITRQLDNYFAEHDKQGNPIFLSNLRFGKGESVADVPSLSGLSINMNIQSTRDNFYKFLEFVKNSGSLDTGVRLMEINSINLNFSEGGEIVKDPKQQIDFNMDMTAYYQTSKVPR